MVDIRNYLNTGIDFLNLVGGIQTSVTKYSYTFTNDDYDDYPTKTLSGSVSFSGIVFPINAKYGSTEALLLEQGKLKTTDKALYCGSIGLTSNEHKFLIGSEYYSLIENGMTTYSIAGSQVYNKVYMRVSNE